MQYLPFLLLLIGLTVSAPTFVDPADVEIDKGLPCGHVFKLSATLQDHMVCHKENFEIHSSCTQINSRTKLIARQVLQRAPASAVVWGFAPPETKVVATFGKHEMSATTDNTSVWRIKLPPTPATKSPQTIAFKASTGETAVLSDVLFGDVYVCGGQVCVICKFSR